MVEIKCRCENEERWCCGRRRQLKTEDALLYKQMHLGIMPFVYLDDFVYFDVHENVKAAK